MGLEPRSFLVDCIDPDKEAWKGVQRSHFLGYKQRVPKKGDETPSLSSVVKQVSKLAVHFKQTDQRWVVLRNGEILVATGPEFENANQQAHKLEALVNLRGTVIANVSEPDVFKFKITEEHGTVHTFKVASLSELHEWLTDLEVVHKGVHYPLPPPVKLLVSMDGISLVNPGTNQTTAHYAYSNVKKFSPLSERSVLLAVQSGRTKDDVSEYYFRSTDGRAREIVSLITDFVKALIEQKEAARKGSSDSSSRRRHNSKSGRSGGDSGGGHRRRRHRKSVDAAGILAEEDARAAADGDDAPTRPAPRMPDDGSDDGSKGGGGGGGRSRRKHYSFSSSDSRSSSPSRSESKARASGSGNDDEGAAGGATSEAAKDDLPPLHPDWKETNSNGAVYYYNVKTRATTWQRDIAVKGGE